MFTVYMFNTDLELATEIFCICKLKVWITLFTPQMVFAVNDSKINAPVLRPYFPPRIPQHAGVYTYWLSICCTRGVCFRIGRKGRSSDDFSLNSLLPDLFCRSELA